MTYRFAPPVPEVGVSGLVSVVLVHHRGTDDLARCIASLGLQAAKLEIVVVDNGSSDPLPDLPASARVLRLPRNLGFAGGANAGLLTATGDHILFLNPDAELDPSCVARMLDADADIVAPRILLRDDDARLDNCGHDLYPDGLNWCRGRGALATGRYMESEDVLLFSGAAVLFRRAALVRTGGFDPSYFAYGEDADLGLRAARLGLICRYEPRAVVRHAVGGSSSRGSLHKVFLVERNRARVAATHLPAPWLLASPALTLLRHGLLMGPAARGEGVGSSWSARQRASLPAVVLAAHAASLAALPGSFRRRRAASRLAPRAERSRFRARLTAATVGPRALLQRPSS
jgi:GT2 family glycosyltransferase